MGGKSLDLDLDNKGLAFQKTGFSYRKEVEVNVFARKTNRTVFETTESPRYRKLSAIIGKYYLEYANHPIGKFLLKCKENNDNFYLRFLNAYGDLKYCQFWIADENLLNERGLYLFTVNNDIKYVGQTVDTFKRRINDGYGRIVPKNCYLDGRSTNCYVNNKIPGHLTELDVFLFPMSDISKITDLERRLIEKYRPPWNSGYRLD